MNVRITVRQTLAAGTDQEVVIERIVKSLTPDAYTREGFAAALATAIHGAAEQDGPVTAIHAFVMGS